MGNCSQNHLNSNNSMVITNDARFNDSWYCVCRDGARYASVLNSSQEGSRSEAAMQALTELFYVSCKGRQSSNGS